MKANVIDILTEVKELLMFIFDMIKEILGIKDEAEAE